MEDDEHDEKGMLRSPQQARYSQNSNIVSPSFVQSSESLIFKRLEAVQLLRLQLGGVNQELSNV